MNRQNWSALQRRALRRFLGDDLQRDDGLCRLAPEWLILVVNNFCNLHCKMCDVGLGDSATVTDENSTQMVAFVRSVEGLRPTSFNFSHLNFITAEMAAAHNASYAGELAVTRSNLGTMNLAAIDLAGMQQAFAELKAHAAGRPGFPSLTVVPDLQTLDQFEVFYRRPETFVGGRDCSDPWRMMMIRTDGTVTPAHGRCYDVPIGNVIDTPMVDLWNHPRFRDFRRTLRGAGGSLPACARCCGIIGKTAAEGPR